jgi:hypothetical protein
MDQINPGKNVRPYSKKITKAKRAGGVADVVECLLARVRPAVQKTKQN